LVQVRESSSTGRWAVGRAAAAALRAAPDTGHSWAATAHLPHVVNVGLLVTGLAIGQGAIFAVQTWLLASGQSELLSLFATHYSFALFGILLTDGSTSSIVARDMVRLLSDHGSSEQFWRRFCEIVVFRLSIAALLGVAAILYTLTIAPAGFSRSYLLAAMPGLLFWAGNATGILDGMKLSGISGMTGAIAYAASAIALTLVPNGSPEQTGLILGGAFSGGYLLGVLVQWAVLKRYGWVPRMRKPTAEGLVRTFKDGTAMVFQLMPGQISLRVLLMLSAIYLGAEPTALFAYIKQVVAALTMMVYVVIRVDFPGLVQAVSRPGKQNFRTIIENQKTTLFCAVVLTAGAVIVCLLASQLPHTRLSGAAHAFLWFSPTIFTTSFSVMMVQAMIALGAFSAVARITAISAGVWIASTYLLITDLGLYALLVGELLSHFVGFALMYHTISRPRHRSEGGIEREHV
jgi:O-antigen/teichoic acid export membrane protein